VAGDIGPSNAARLRMFVRRLRAGGAGIAEEFLVLVRHALAHYGVLDLAPSDPLERALLRLFASQRAPALRRRLVLGLVRRLTAIARAGRRTADDPALSDALERIAGMRGLVGDALADAAVEARHALFERPAIERDAARASKEVEAWLAVAEAQPSSPPGAVLAHLAAAPPEVFARVGRWLGDTDVRRRAIALSAHLRRLYLGSPIWQHASGLRGEHVLDRLELGDGRVVFATSAGATELQHGVERLVAAAAAERGSVAALDLLVPDVELADVPRLVAALFPLLPDRLGATRLTLAFVAPDGAIEHRTFEANGDGRLRERVELHGLHPEVAVRLDLERLRDFDLERLDARDGIVAFHARSRAIPEDERIFVLADVRGRLPGDGDDALDLAGFERAFYEATRRLRSILLLRDPDRRLQWNRLSVFVSPAVRVDGALVERLAQRLEPATHHLGLEKVVVRVSLQGEPGEAPRAVEIVISDPTGSHMELAWREPHHDPLRPASAYERRVVEARRRRLVYPYEIVRMLAGGERGKFEEWDLDPAATAPTARPVPQRPPGANESGVVFGVLSTPTDVVPEGLQRVLVLSDPTRGMGSLSGPECDRIVAAIDLAEREELPVEWVPVSSGAKIAMDSGTENLDATARVVKRIVEFTDAGGTIHVVVHGVNVGAQSYFDALATMGMRTKGALVMTPGASLVLTGRAALEASGSVAAEDELGIGGFERVMGPNGEAQYYARDLAEAFRVLARHYDYSYVVPGEKGPRRRRTRDPFDRTVADEDYVGESADSFRTVGELFDAATNPDRKRPFSMRAVMRAVVDQDGGHLERWRSWVGAETAIVWDARIGGFPVCLVGIESHALPREGYRPPDGPATWTGGTLFPLSSKKIARALYAASGNRPALILANLSGFDGSPESMRKLQLEYGAEIARAVVRFRGPLLFLVVSRYHGGAYVVFSRSLNPKLRAAALEGSFASVIGGGPAATVVLARDVRARALTDPRVASARASLGADPSAAAREAFDRVFGEVLLEKQRELAAEFDAVHTVERALRVGSLEEIIPADGMRPWVIARLEEELG
jgi:acetyl-CoA carboxylase carboxyltransferase component